MSLHTQRVQRQAVPLGLMSSPHGRVAPVGFSPVAGRGQCLASSFPARANERFVQAQRRQTLRPKLPRNLYCALKMIARALGKTCASIRVFRTTDRKPDSCSHMLFQSSPKVSASIHPAVSVSAVPLRSPL